MTYQGRAATPPKLYQVWEALADRLRTNLGALPGYTDASQVYRSGRDPYTGKAGEQWWRVQLQPIIRAWPTPEQPGRTSVTPFYVRAEVSVPDGLDAEPMLENLQAEAFAALHGHRPGTLASSEGTDAATVRLPIVRDDPPDPVALWDADAELWYSMARYIVTVETPDLSSAFVPRVWEPVTGLTATVVGADVELSWDAHVDASDYRVYQDGAALALSGGATSYTAVGAAAEAHAYEVAAVNEAGGTGPTSLAALAGGATPATLVTDDFDRADGALGAPWTNAFGEIAVRSNRAEVIAVNSAGSWPSNGAGAYVDAGAPDFAIEFDYIPNSNGPYGFVFGRYVDDTHFVHAYPSGFGAVRMWVKDGSSHTQMAYAVLGEPFAAGVPALIRAEFVGPTVRILKDGKAIIAGTFSNAVMEAATTVGLFYSNTSLSASAVAKWDNVVVEEM